jgi:hypothetical protein
MAETMKGPDDHMFSHVSSTHSRSKGTFAIALLMPEWEMTPGEGSRNRRLATAWRTRRVQSSLSRPDASANLGQACGLE